MLYQMTIRPDDIYRTGVIQPFNVVSQSPVSYARQEIAPFVEALRPEGSLIAEGNLGIVSPEVLRTLSSAGLGQESIVKQIATKQIAELETQRWYFGVGGVVLGLAAGFALGKWVL